MTHSITKRLATATFLCAMLASSLMWNVASAEASTASDFIAQLKAQLVALQTQLQTYTAATTTGTISKPSASQIQVGDRVETVSALRVRSTPDTTGAVLGVVKDHVQGTVVEQSLTTSGTYTWWKVAYDTGLTGWSAQPWLAEVATGAPENTPACEAFYFSPSTITKGQQTVATWNLTANGTVQMRSSAGDFNKSFSPTGTYTFNPATTTTYTLTGVGKDGSAITCVASVIVKATAAANAPVCDYAYFTPAAVQEGQPTTMKWKVSNATKVVLTSTLKDINKDFGLEGSYTFTPTDSAAYALTAFGADGTKTTCATSIIVDEDLKGDVQDAKKATCDSFTFTPATSPRPGAPVVMTWSTTNGVRAISTSSLPALNNYNFPLKGTYTIYPLRTSENSLTVYGAGSTANQDTCYATVTVAS